MTKKSDVLSDEELQAEYNSESDGIPIYSAKISEICKYIWAGSLAFFYATLSSGKETVAYGFYQQNKHYILAAAICGSIALIADYVQNVCGLEHASKFTNWIENTDEITRDQFNAHTTSVYSKLNTLFFWLQNIFCIAAALLTAYSIVNFITH
jgi:hypothetical protein